MTDKIEELIERLRAIAADDAGITTAELIRYAATMAEAADALAALRCGGMCAGGGANATSAKHTDRYPQPQERG